MVGAKTCMEPPWAGCEARPLPSANYNGGWVTQEGPRRRLTSRASAEAVIGLHNLTYSLPFHVLNGRICSHS
jgi:hypothetical protein